MITEPYAAAQASAASLAQVTGQSRHDVAVVLGSGFAPAADALGTAAAEIPLADLGGFPAPTVPGHTGMARSLAVGPAQVLVLLGRVHLYEGHPVEAVVHGVRTAVAAGCRVVVLTNASGGINPALRVGEPVLISDHLNLTGRSPLAGPNPPDGYGPRFTDLTDLYSARLRVLARRADPGIAEGVYAGLPGPHYETPAEIRMLRTLGADLVGMSTVLEAIAARHLGAEVLGISLVSNAAAGLAPPHGAAPGAAAPDGLPAAAPLDHEEVIAVGRASAARVGALLARLLPSMAGPA